MSMMKKKPFREIYELWREDKRHFVKQSSLSTYVVIAESYLLKPFGEMTEITEIAIQSFVLEKLDEGFSQKTVRDMLTVFRMILRYGAKQGVTTIPAWDVHLPHAINTSPAMRVLSVEEQQRLTDYLTEHFSCRNFGLLLCLLAGLRIGEVCALKWGDIDLERRVVSIRRTVNRVYLGTGHTPHSLLMVSTPKTANSRRDIPLARSLADLLHASDWTMHTDAFVLSDSAKLIEPSVYRSYYQTLMRRLALPNLRFHGLRHTFATRCVESQCDVKTLSTLLGHANISTTMNLYVHPTFEQKRSCIDRMMETLSKP